MNTLQKIVAAVAREQGNNIVDLAQIESDVRIAILQRMIEKVWQAFGAGLIEADPAEQMLRSFEDKLFVEMIERPPPVAEQNKWRSAHRAARGVRKVRGAK
jgi:hypothetical protein